MKNIILIMAMLLLMAGVRPLQAKTIGDFNEDGKVNILDVIEFLNHLNGNKKIEEIGQEYSQSSSAAENILFSTLPEVTLGSNGINQEITEINLIEANEIIIDELFKVWRLSREILEDNVITIINGQHSGTITWAGTMSGDSELEYVNYEAVFDNYSRNGELFLSGKFRYSDGMKLNLQHLENTGYDQIFLGGHCRITGKYKGYVWYHVKIIDWFQGDHYNYFGDCYVTTKTSDGQSTNSFGAYLYKDENGTDIPDDWRGGVTTPDEG